MQKILSELLYFVAIGLFLSFFFYVAAFLLPILAVVALCFWAWVKYKHKKMLDLWQFYQKKQQPRASQEDIIDVEYEVIDDHKNQR